MWGMRKGVQISGGLVEWSGPSWGGGGRLQVTGC